MASIFELEYQAFRTGFSTGLRTAGVLYLEVMLPVLGYIAIQGIGTPYSTLLVGIYFKLGQRQTLTAERPVLTEI